MTTLALPAPRAARVEDAGLFVLAASVGASQVSIAAAQVLLALGVLCWITVLAVRHEAPDAPPFFATLGAYAFLTLLSASLSIDPAASLIDSKQLLLFVIVPAIYRLARGPRGGIVLLVVISVGAASAAYGIYQYGILKYDWLGKRPQGAMGHYMTYSGLLMLATCAAVARVLFRKEERTWPALVLPALLVALAATFTRSAWVGTCAAIALLLVLKDLRLIAVLPLVAAIGFSLAPANLTNRVYSMFDVNDPTNRDRIAMLRAGVKIVEDYPLTGVGPNNVERVYRQYRDAYAVQPVNPHLHNVPMQIAAERGLLAVGAWIAFLVVLLRALWRTFRTAPDPSFAAAGIAATVAMVTAGMFEYNFGDSEFLMLYLALVTLPFATARPDEA